MDTDARKFSLEDSFYKKQFDKHLVHNVYKGGQWGSYRHLLLKPVENVKSVSAICQLEKLGDFSSFKWIENSLNFNEKLEENSIARVYYSGLNFRDIMMGSKKLSNLDLYYYSRLLETCLGLEFSGREENGDRIMGIVSHNGISTFVQTLPYFTWKVPNNMTLEEAATIPVVYITVIYAFFFKMCLRKGATVLIHAAAGGVGQAAINICLHYNCNIFVTVGTPDKVEFITKTYPQIPESHICNSRNTSFETTVMRLTKGKGVDVVLNSLSDDKLQASVRCVARGGYFLEIGKSDTDVGRLSNEVTFCSVQIDLLIWIQDKVVLKLRKKFQEMLDLGIIKPIKRKIFQIDEVATAFRFMASAKHIGKVLIKLQDEEIELKAKPSLKQINAKPYVTCQKEKSYLIIGGMGGFGLELADWLVFRGARNIVLSSRSGIKNGYQMSRVSRWQSYGVQVVISVDDVTNETGMKMLLQKALALGPLAGIFNVAVVLKDGPFRQQCEESFRETIGSKATATIFLDKLTRKMCPELEHFVVFSSVLCGRGNPDSTNYAFANSIMERICEARKFDNLPALAIQWGAIGDVGVFFEMVGCNESTSIGGVSQQKIESCLNTLNALMKQPSPVVSSMIVATKHHTETDVISVVANTLGITDINTISLTWTLPELGMDSILAMELRQVLESEYSFFFTPEELRKLTFAKLYRPKEDKLKSSQLGEEKKSKKLNEHLLRIPFENEQILKQLPVDETPTVFVFPGVEGVAVLMERLVKNLSVQSLCFQYYDKESAEFLLTKLRDHFAELILEKLGPDQEFCMIGYSLGGLIAIEVASILEENGRKGHIWLIDSSPAYIFERVKTHKTQKLQSSRENTQKAIDENITQQVANERIQLLKKNISNYKFSHAPLESSCTLINSMENFSDKIDSDDLTEFFRNPVQVHEIRDADHFTILGNLETAKIIMESSVWTKNWTNIDAVRL